MAVAQQKLALTKYGADSHSLTDTSPTYSGSQCEKFGLTAKGVATSKLWGYQIRDMTNAYIRSPTTVTADFSLAKV